MNFNSKSRKLNSMLASGAGLINQVIQILGNFVYRTVFLMILSKEYLGINGLFSNVLQIFSLAELGIGSAILYNMYGAFSKQDTDKIGQLVSFYKRIYSSIALFILAAGIAFYPFLDSIINFSEVPADVNITLVYFLFVGNSVASYLFVYKLSLLTADQRDHLVILFRTLTLLIGYVVKIIVLVLSKHYVLVLACDIGTTLLLNFLFSLWTTKKYRSVFQVKSKLPAEERKEIFKSTQGLMCHKIGTVVVSSTDNIIISKYISLAAVGLYSNYGTLVSSITKVGISLISGMLPSVANYFASQTKENTYKMMKRVLFANLWISSFTTVCLFVLLNPFISIWLGNDFLMSYVVVGTVCFQHYLQIARLSANTFVYSAGLFMRDKLRPLIESAINLIVSILLAKTIGIAGVFIGTCVSGLLTYFWREPYLLFKEYFHSSSAEYWWTQIKWLALTVVMCGAMYALFTLFPGGILWLLVRFALAAIIPNLIILLFTIRSEEFHYILSFVTKKFLRKFQTK